MYGKKHQATQNQVIHRTRNCSHCSHCNGSRNVGGRRNERRRNDFYAFVGSADTLP